MKFMLNGKLCLKSRDLLKWNIQDLSQHSGVPTNLIDKFEKGRQNLRRNENMQLKETFEDNGIHFPSPTEAYLSDEKKKHYAKREVYGPPTYDQLLSAKAASKDVLERIKAKKQLQKFRTPSSRYASSSAANTSDTSG